MKVYVCVQPCHKSKVLKSWINWNPPKNISASDLEIDDDANNDNRKKFDLTDEHILNFLYLI